MLENFLEEMKWEILFNGKNKIINYRKVYNFSNDILEIPKNNVKLYEVIYKNKCFYIIDDKSEYTNKEIRILIDLISFPLFSRKEIKKESKNIDENSLNIEIEKVKLLNNSNNGYISYKITDENNKNIDFTESNKGFIQIKLNKSTNVKIEPKMTKIEEISYIISIIGIIILIINIIISNKKERERACQNQ